MSFTNRGQKGRGVWRAVPFIKNDALENCLIKILRSESPGKTINKNFGVKAKKNLVSYLCMQKFVLKSDTHVRCIKFHRKVNMCETFPGKCMDEITGTFHLATTGHFLPFPLKSTCRIEKSIISC